MFLNLLVDIILLTIIIAGSYYGYRKGLLAIAFKPAKALLRVILTLSLCIPFGETFIAPIVSANMSIELPEVVFSLVVKVVATVLGFILLFVIFGVVLSIFSELLELLVSSGILGRINGIVGLVVASAASLIVAWGFASITSEIIAAGLLDGSDLVNDFDGGPIFNLLTKASFETT